MVVNNKNQKSDTELLLNYLADISTIPLPSKVLNPNNLTDKVNELITWAQARNAIQLPNIAESQRSQPENGTSATEVMNQIQQADDIQLDIRLGKMIIGRQPPDPYLEPIPQPGPPGPGDPAFYGEIYTDTNVAGQTIVDADTFVVVTAFTDNGISNGMTPDHTADTITIDNAGIYVVSGAVSFSGSANNTFHFSAFIDGVKQPNIASEKGIPTAVTVGAFPLTGLLSLSGGEVLDLRVESSGANKTININHVNMNIQSVGANGISDKGPIFPVILAQTAGSQGDETTAASWVYTVTDARTGFELATGVNPVVSPHKWQRPTVGQMLVATFGYAHYVSGNILVVGWTNEIIDLLECNG